MIASAKILLVSTMRQINPRGKRAWLLLPLFCLGLFVLVGYSFRRIGHVSIVCVSAGLSVKKMGLRFKEHCLVAVFSFCPEYRLLLFSIIMSHQLVS